MKWTARTALFLGGAAAGGVHGFVSGQPGHRKDAAREGALSGAVTGLVIASAPALLKRSAGSARRAFTAGAAAAKAKGKVMFRRIGGRIIPIRMK